MSKNNAYEELGCAAIILAIGISIALIIIANKY